jgi:outer membrane protein W
VRRILTVFLCVFPLLVASSPSFAQDEEGDVYDPFIDYSEFEEAGEEEADVNFFRNGRLFTAGLAVGQRSFTEGMAGIFQDDVIYGLYLSYFFDLRMALQFSYLTGSHGFKLVPIAAGTTVIGEAKMSSVGIDMKYYFNTQNVTKGLAAFNPYVLAGFSSVSRESNRVGQTEFSTEKAFGFDAAVGVEFPVGSRNDMYLGLQAMYQLVNFKNESTPLTAGGGATGKYANGDLITATAILGVNF